jgi:hypothetical protein
MLWGIRGVDGSGLRGVPLLPRRGTLRQEGANEQMGSSGLVRWGAIGLMLGGVVWLVLGLSSAFGYLQAIPGREDVVLLILALLLTAAGLVGLHALQAGKHGLVGQAGFYITFASLVARALAAGVYLAGSSALSWISYPWGTIGMLVGLVAYGLATLRAGVLPRWYGLALIVTMPLSLPLAAYGSALFGLIMVVLGYALWSQKGTTTEQQPQRVR